MSENPVTHYLCIGCPLGCRLEVEQDGDGDIAEVRGWSCKKGERYGRQEHTDPRRMVTTTVRLAEGGWARLPVKTSDAVPKDRVRDICAFLRTVAVSAPVSLGETVVSDVLGCGVDIVATRDANRSEAPAPDHASATNTPTP